MSHSTQLSASDLAIGYQDKHQSQTLARELNLQLEAGQLVCLLGPNGAGKSTLIRTLCGMQQPLGGSIHLDGTSLKSISPRERAKRISVVLTDNMPIGMMDAYTLVSLGRHPYSGWLGRLNSHDLKSIEDAIQAVGADKLTHRQVAELSDGERQKISIARALAQEASIMLLDEPTAFLDLPRKVELMKLLQNLTHTKQMGLLLSTHDLDLALRFADKVWILSERGTLTQGTPESLKEDNSLAQAFGCESFE